MARVLSILLILCVAGTLVTAGYGQSSSISRSGVAVTRRYLEAMHKLRRAERREASASDANVRRLIEHVRSQCPNVLAGAPQTKAVEDLRVQTLYQVDKAKIKPIRHAIIAFAETAVHLRWHRKKLDYYIHGSAEEDRANAKLIAPDLCEEAHAIVADGYQAVPRVMVRFERQVEAANSKVAIESGPGQSGDLNEIILSMLRPYERSGEASLIPRKPPKQEIERGIKSFLYKAIELVRALGLPVEESSGRQLTR